MGADVNRQDHAGMLLACAILFHFLRSLKLIPLFGNEPSLKKGAEGDNIELNFFNMLV